MEHEMGERARRLDEDPMTLIERFHGHVGPYVVLGYRSGRLARERLDVTAFKMEADVFAGIRPPMSCFADGVQLGSGCTLGKHNITLHEEQLVEARFRARDGRSLVVRVRPEALGRIVPGMDPEAMDRFSRELLAMPEEEVFQVSGDR